MDNLYCIECSTTFTNRPSFQVHLITDHWWDPSAAEDYLNHILDQQLAA